MVEIVKTYRQSVPPLRFIGIPYGDKDRKNGGFGEKWCEWFAAGRFGALEKLCPQTPLFEDADAYIGLMRWKEGEPFQYWIGMFLPEGAPVPDGFSSVDFAAADLGVVWLKGPEQELYAKEDLCGESCRREGFTILPDEAGAFWFFERYACPRFLTPDEEGRVTLDICHYIQR